MQLEDMEKIKDMIDDLRAMRHGTDTGLYRDFSGAISSLRAVLRRHGKDYEPD